MAWPGTVASALGLMLLGATACEPASELALSESSAEIKHGTVWNPWSSSSHAWTRNVVKVGGCTGTLIDREWVLTASHCFSASTQPGSVSVSHLGSDGSTTYTRGVELFRSPNLFGRNQDVALLRIEDPIDTGQGGLDFFTGSTASLVGDRVLCAGYGWTDVDGSCNTSADCASGFSCGGWNGGKYCRKTASELRVAWMDVISDPDDGNSFYRFDVPNSAGQMLLPGDSGSTCMGPGGLTGVHKAGNLSNYNRQTSAAVFRSWANGIVRPPQVAQSNLPGAACEWVGDPSAVPNGYGELENPSTSSRTLVCPVQRAQNGSGNFANVFRAPRVFVRDQHPSLDICCALQTKNPGGASKESSTVCSSGSSSGYQTLNVPTVYDNYTWSQVSLRCTVPGITVSGRSGMLTYRSLQSLR